MGKILVSLPKLSHITGYIDLRDGPPVQASAEGRHAPGAALLTG